jgi:hypothetical protein
MHRRNYHGGRPRRCRVQHRSRTHRPRDGLRPVLPHRAQPRRPGTLVSRGEGGFFSTFKPPGAFVAIALTARAAEETCRGGDPELGALRSMFVEKPNGDVHLLFKSDHKVPLLLYPAGTEDICSGSPVAEGTGTMTEVSSNVFGGSGRGTSGFRFRETVTDLAGERHHVLVVVHSQLGPNGFVDLVRKINVN